MRPANQQHRPFVLHTRIVKGTGGGPEKTILNSPRFLRTHGIDSACLFMHPPNDAGFASLEQRAARADAEIIGVDDPRPLNTNIIRQAIRVCRERRVDIWHAHDYKSNVLGLIVRRFHRMHLVTTAHGWVQMTGRTPLYYKIDRACMKWYERVLCVSQDLVERCEESGIPRERLRLVHNAIVETDYDTSAPTDAQRRRFGFGPDQIILGAVGRLSEEKGFDVLLEAVSRLVEEGRNIGLVIAGEGGLKEQLQDQIKQLELHDRVQLKGYLADPRELYRAIDLYVLSSRREGLPNVVLEAMASQRAVVATNVNGVPKLVRDRQNGIVVPTDDVTGLTNGIRRLLVSPELREQMAASARQTIEREFSFARRMEKVVDVYRSLNPRLAQRIPSVSREHQAADDHPARPVECPVS